MEANRVRELTGSSASVLDHLDSCAICRFEGLDYCAEAEALLHNLRFARFEVLGRADLALPS